MKQIIYARLAFLVILGAIIAYTLFYFTFAIVLPLLMDDLRTVILGLLLAVWMWRFRYVMKAIFKWVKI